MQDTASLPSRAPAHVLGARVLGVLAAAFVIGWVLNGLALKLDKTDRPAGFVRGLVQGALTPAALPNLLIGHDVVFYSVNNNGLFYKIGYTLGINLCGLVFFSFFFRRVNQWRRSR